MRIMAARVLHHDHYGPLCPDSVASRAEADIQDWQGAGDHSFVNEEVLFLFSHLTFLFLCLMTEAGRGGEAEGAGLGRDNIARLLFLTDMTPCNVFYGRRKAL